MKFYLCRRESYLSYEANIIVEIECSDVSELYGKRFMLDYIVEGNEKKLRLINGKEKDSCNYSLPELEYWINESDYNIMTYELEERGIFMEQWYLTSDMDTLMEYIKQNNILTVKPVPRHKEISGVSLQIVKEDGIETIKEFDNFKFDNAHRVMLCKEIASILPMFAKKQLGSIYSIESQIYKALGKFNYDDEQDLHFYYKIPNNEDQELHFVLKSNE